MTPLQFLNYFCVVQYTSQAEQEFLSLQIFFRKMLCLKTYCIFAVSKMPFPIVFMASMILI
uniref:Uncharacterized protein n=1 Tax=Arundo donax TaxID=35708 RepID=A0A0A9AUC1_ARUDO